MKQLELLGPDGALAVFDFGEVPAGQLSPPLAISLTNTGDQPLSGVCAWITQDSLTDGSLRVMLAGIPILGTSRSAPTPLPDLPPGAAHSGTAEFTSPTVPVDVGTLWYAAD